LTKNFSWRNFMMRRILRIWPLYFLIIGLGVAVWLIKPGTSVPDWWWYMGFLANFYIIKHGDNFLFFLTFLWSISVEEQFYFFWSLLLKWVHRFLPAIFVLLILGSIIFRFFNYDNGKIMYFHTVSILGNFGVGGLLAYLSFYSKSFLRFIENMPKWATALPYLLLVIFVAFYYTLFSSPVNVAFERLFFSIIFGWIIIEQNFARHSIIKWGNFKPLNYLGKISYGLYMYHGVVLTFLAIAGWNNFISYSANIGISMLALGITILISAISFKYFERPFLKLKERFYTFDK